MTTAIRQSTRFTREATWLVPCVLAAAGVLLTSDAAHAQDPAPAEEAPAAPPEEAAPPTEGAAPTNPAETPPADAPPADAPPADAPPGDVSAELTIDEAALADAAPAEDTGELDEVVVTVDRRRKNLQDYSGTAAAFSERDLSREGINNVRDLQIKVPGLQIGNQEGNTEIFIRGVGSDNNTELGDPAVALHLDGVYLPRPRGMGAMFFDIARVEVNSGPQGTLRGRNALGGTVNIITNEPKLGEYEANAEATFGTFSQRRYQGMVNIPLGDSLAIRAAAFSDVHDPHWENAGPLYDVSGAESIDAYAFRGQIKWQPAPVFKALVAYDFTRERGSGWLGANFQGPLTQRVDENDPPTPMTNLDDTPIPIDPDDIENPRRTYQRGMQSALDMKHHGVRTTLTLDAGAVLFEATGSYRNMRFTQNNGSNAGVVYPGYTGDANTPDNFTSGYWNQGSRSMMGELRAFAPDTERFRWTVGGFVFDEDQDTFLGNTNDRSNGFGGSEFPMPLTEGFSIAGFADATFDVVETFRVLGGVRVTHDEKSRHGGLWALWTGWVSDNANPPRFGTEGFQYHGVDSNILSLPDNHTVENRVNLFLDGIKSFGARDTIPQYLCADPVATAPGEPQQQRLELIDGHFRCANGIHPNLLAADEAWRADPTMNQRPFDIQAVPQNNDTSARFVDWRAGVEFDLAPDSLLYATVSTGHKSGGFNDTATGTGGLIDTNYDPESVIAFELGSKNTLLDRRLRLNASAFYYRYTDQVFQTIVSVSPPDPVTGMGGSNTAVRDNASASNILGLDLDVVYSLPAGLEAEVHALLMDARFGDDVTVHDARLGFDISEYPVDIGGNWLPRVSPLTLNYNLSQMIFTEAGTFDWIISGQTRTKQYQTVFNGEGELLPATDGRIPRNDAGVILDSYAALAGDPDRGYIGNPARLTDVIEAYTAFNLGGGWRHPDGRLSISGFVNNVFNIAYPTSIIATPGLNLRFFNPPRTAGVRMRVDW